MSNKESEEAPSIGWNAIDNALAALYGDQEPKHLADVAQSLHDAIRPTAGTYRVEHWNALEFEVVPIEIKDQDGNLTEVVG